jgi:hypothetical protein
MRFYEISSGLRIPISEEEQELFDLITKGSLEKSALDERQQEVARNMVTRGLLIRENKDGVIILRPNNAADIWRF